MKDLSLKKIITVLTNNLSYWVDSDHKIFDPMKNDSEDIDWPRLIPFIFLHISCLLAFYVGFTSTALGIAIVSYGFRMFAITAFYHRYFSHRSFKTNRFWQFLFAIFGACSVQRGALWWAAHHRKHHKESDQDQDLHSPVKRSFLWSHMGWFCCKKNFHTNYDAIKDLKKFPELVFLNRFDFIIPVVYGIFMYFLGVFLGSDFMGLNITGAQSFVWGFIISTVILFHGTFTINSLAHIYGKKRYPTSDNSRNNFLLALITLGEGWHNNHHHYPYSTRQGFFWWEFDPTWYVLKLMAYFKIIKDLKTVPEKILLFK